MRYDPEQLQADIEARFESWPYFSDVTIAADHPGMIEDDVIKALSTLNEKAGKNGTFLLVMMPEESVQFPDMAGPEVTIQMAVRVYTDALYNMDPATGTLKGNASLRREARRALHHWCPMGSNAITCDKRCGQVIDGPEGSVAYELLFNMIQPDGYFTTPGQPMMSISYEGPGGVVTLTQAEGEEIRYTMDGSFPGPEAALYSGPIEVAFTESPTIRAAAYKAGYGSSITQVSLLPLDVLRDHNNEVVFDDQNYPILTQ